MKDGEISQVGTPEEIVANPIDQYVKDFCEDVPKYKVLSAGKVMRKEFSKETKKLYEDKSGCINDNSKIELEYVVGEWKMEQFSDGTGIDFF